jgi:hypothetical protein
MVGSNVIAASENTSTADAEKHAGPLHALQI